MLATAGVGIEQITASVYIIVVNHITNTSKNSRVSHIYSCKHNKKVDLFIFSEYVDKPKDLYCGKELVEEGCHIIIATHMCTKKVNVNQEQNL